jgi:hypothetical protein
MLFLNIEQERKQRGGYVPPFAFFKKLEKFSDFLQPFAIFCGI